MRPSEYQKEVITTHSDIYENKNEIPLVIAALGMNAEAGEFANKLKKSLEQGKEYTKYELTDELGDTLWYLTLLCHLLNTDLEEVMIQNIKKLKERHGEKYNSNYSAASSNPVTK